MPIFLPTASSLVLEKTLKATDAMWAWMRDITKSANGGGGIVTNVSATAPIVSSGGVTPNISHAVSGVTAATYGDASHVPQIAVNVTGHVTSASNVAITGVAITQLTGDITAGPGTGSQVATIAANAVTFAKMQDLTTQRVIGRNTAGTGDPEEVTVSQLLDWTP